jgi:hypothetical protein
VGQDSPDAIFVPAGREASRGQRVLRRL